MKKILQLFLISCFIMFSATNVNAQLNVSYAGSLDYDEVLNDIWGYVAPDGTEYAIVGVYNGVSVVSLADPTNPTELFFIPGAESTWRDIKTWDGFAYVTNETANGLAVIDLTGLPEEIDSYDWTPNIFGLGELSSIHNIYIDEFGYAYLAGANINNGGVLYIDVFSEPGVPKFAGNGPAVYSHDVYTRDNIMYSSEIYEGSFAIYDVADKGNTIYQGGAETLSNFTHNAWLSDDSNYLFTTDEVANGSVGSFDVSDPTDVKELDQFFPYETLGDGVIPHNVHVWNDWIIISYYTDGCIIVDGSKPDNLVEVGNFDTFIPESTGFLGAWGAYPYLPSGLILISDIGNGLYVLEPNYVRACWLEGNIANAETSELVPNASIKINNTNVVSKSAFDGSYAIGYAISGSYEIEVSKPGFETKTVITELNNGELTALNVELTPLPSFAISGNVIDANTNLIVQNATVIVSNDVYTFEVETDDFGSFSIPNFYEGDYDVAVAKWGYKAADDNALSISSVNNLITIYVEEGYEDTFSYDLGWEVQNDAFGGGWEIGESMAFDPGIGLSLTPPADVEEDAGNSCYITGNIPDFNGFVVQGENSLTSPVFKIADFEEPKLSFYYWYLNGDQNSQQPSDNFFFEIEISNGSETHREERYLDSFNNGVDWEYYEINLADSIPVTDDMTIKFTVAAAGSIIAEGGVDYFRVWDAAAAVETSLEEVNENLTFEVSPNPSNNTFTINYQFEEMPEMPTVKVYNTLGQFVESVSLNDENGTVTLGENLSNGIYYIQIADGFKVSKSLKIVKQ